MLLKEEIVRTDDPDPPAGNATVDELREGMGPEGETVAVRDRLPESPLTLVKEMLELEEVPAGIDKDAGLAEIVKSTT